MLHLIPSPFGANLLPYLPSDGSRPFLHIPYVCGSLRIYTSIPTFQFRLLVLDTHFPSIFILFERAGLKSHSLTCLLLHLIQSLTTTETFASPLLLISIHHEDCLSSYHVPFGGLSGCQPSSCQAWT